MGESNDKPAEPTLEQLTQDVRSLQKDMATQKGFIKRLGTLLAFLAALFAVPKGAIDLLQSVRARPNTQITQEPYLSFAYDPKTKTVGFGFDFTVSNTGTTLDTIKNVSGRLERIDYTSAPLLSFADTSFHFFENNAAITNRFPINKESTRSLRSQVGAYLSDDNRNSFLQPKSRWRLQVEFTGEYEKKYVVPYCFDISKTIADDVSGAKEKLNKRILNPWCE